MAVESTQQILRDSQSAENRMTPRTEKALHAATRPFASEYPWKSWWIVASTFICLGVALTAAALLPWWPLRLIASVVAGLLLVRTFILFHDFVHGSLLRGSRLARALFQVYGLVTLTPARNWRQSHNFHHANVGKPIEPVNGKFSFLTSDIGAFPLMTTDMWRNSTSWQRLRYRLNRHPVTILGAYFTVFLGSLCLAPLIQNPRKNWEAMLAMIVHGVIVALLWVLAGVSTLFFAFLLPFGIAAAMGAYLFFAQHNFKGMRIIPVETWTHFRGALESSSYMKMGPVMNWFTGNIGYHHVHHMNSLIPFYRLPETMAAIPELQHPIETSLHPRDIIACLQLNLWDQQSQQLVSYGEANPLNQAKASRKGAV